MNGSISTFSHYFVTWFAPPLAPWEPSPEATITARRARPGGRAAIGAIELFENRDRIESANNHLHTISDAAYYYAGLSFGLTLADFS